MTAGLTARPHRRQVVTFFVAASFTAMTGAVFDTTFNNYVSSTFHIGAGQRGVLEFPREFPGFAVALLTGALMFLPEVRVASVGTLAAAVGMVGLAFWTPSYGTMMVWMVLFSAGAHLMMPTEGAIALGLADPRRRGRRLGQLGLATTSAALLACLVLYFILRHDPLAFRTTFLIGAGLALVSSALYRTMQPHIPHNAARPRIVFRRRYALYYALCAFFGARKQIFLTFGPWVIVTVFHKEAYVLAVLYLVSRLISMGFRPLLGRLIDRFGPRRILQVEAVVLILVCLGYVAALQVLKRLPEVFAVPLLGVPMRSVTLALAIVYPCYVIDDLMFAAEMARSTYAAHLAPSRDDLTGTLALGVSINHAISVLAPVFGGALWIAAGGAEPVFLVAAGIMVGSGVCAFFVRAPAHVPSPPATPSPAIDP
jgi:MFS family permease